MGSSTAMVEPIDQFERGVFDGVAQQPAPADRGG